MTTYIVENTATEKTSSHATWGGAMRAAVKMAGGDESNIRIIERDRDGEREYNLKGQQLRTDGHYR